MAYIQIDCDATDLLCIISALKNYSSGYARMPNMARHAKELQNHCEKKLAVLNELESRQ